MAVALNKLINAYIDEAKIIISNHDEIAAKAYFEKIQAAMNQQPSWHYDLMFMYKKCSNIYLNELPNIIDALNSYKIARKDEDRNARNNRSQNNGFSLNVNQSANQVQNQSQKQSQNVDFSFDLVIDEIKDNSILSKVDKEEIIKKIEDLKSIFQSQDPRSNRWDKISPIMEWLLTKGVDVACKILPLILKTIA